MRSKFSFLLFSLVMVCCAARAQPPQRIYTYAGNGFSGFSGDGSNASGASLWAPIDVIVDAAANVYVSDHLNYRVRKINAGGLITTIAGNGSFGSNGNGSIGTSATIVPRCLALDKIGNLYISDDASNVIRKVDNLGIIHAFAGNSLAGYAGDGQQASAARFLAPSGIAIDKNGNMFVADMGNHVVRKISAAGIVSTVVGNHLMGFSGNDGPATAASLDSPYAVAVDRWGALYISDYGNNVVRKVDTDNVIRAFAGKHGVYGYAGDNALDTAALLNGPRGLAVDSLGNVFIADANNNVVRKVNYATGIISTVAGNGTYGFGGDLGYAVGANLFNPYGLAVDAQGSIYIADANNERIRKTYYPTVSVTNIAGGSSIGVYPNPAFTSVTVTGLAAQDNVALFDVTGRQVTTSFIAASQAPQSFSISSLEAGLYLIRVTDANGAAKANIRLIKE